jgi:hypothetical protein
MQTPDSAPGLLHRGECFGSKTGGHAQAALLRFGLCTLTGFRFDMPLHLSLVEWSDDHCD